MEQPTQNRHSPIAHHPVPKHHAIPRHHLAKPASKTSRISFSTTEITSILISMVTLILAFRMFNIWDTGIVLGIVLGITLHEIGHKVVAQSMGFESKYKLWEIGIVLVVAFAIISRGRLIFAAPGFVVTEGHATDREQGIISLSAPSTNILLAVLLLGTGKFGASMAYVNTMLAIFNLLPIGPLDGAKVMKWSPGVWTAAFGLALALGALFLLRPY